MTGLSLEQFSSILNFVGGAILCIDALRIRFSIREESGARRFLEVMGRVGGSEVLKDKRGKPLSTETALQLWLSERSLRWAWVGFALMTVGFLLDILAMK